MKRVWILAALVLAVSVIVVLTPRAFNQAADQWLTYTNTSTPNFVVFYNSTNPKYENDAMEMLGYVNAMLFGTDGNLVYKQYPYDTTFASYNLNPPGFPGYVAIYLYDRITWYDMGYTESTWFESSGAINCLSRSDVSTSDTWVKDPLYYEKNFVHEFVHVITYGDLKTQYDQMPFWFSEGTAEYIAVFCTTTAIKNKYLNNPGGDFEGLMSRAITEVPTMFNYPGDYVLAAYVGKYMYEDYYYLNVPPVVSMWKNPLKITTFWDAVETYFLPVKTKFMFEQRWLEWASDQFGVGNRYPFLDADTNKDGIVNLADLVTIALHYGQTLASVGITDP